MDTINQPPSPQPTVEQTPVPPKPSVDSKTLLIAVVVLIVVMIGLVTYILAARTKPNFQRLSSPISPTLSQPSPTPVDETANWKTYTFKRINSTVPQFQIKYPSTWDYREISAGDPLDLIFYTGSIGELPRQVFDTSPPDDKSLPKPPKAPIELQVSVGAFDRCPCLEGPWNIIAAGISAKRMKLEAWEIVDITKSGYTFSLMREIKQSPNTDRSISSDKAIEIFDQILSTFQFLN